MVINQLHSIGDLIFLEPMYRHFLQKEGKKPIVPVRDHLMWLQNYIDSAEFVRASLYSFDQNKLDVTDNYLPLRWANQIMRDFSIYDHHDFENMMADKYTLAGLDPELWKTVKLNFNVESGKRLMEHLGLTSKKYCLVNEYSQAGNIEIKIDGNEYEIVYMRPIDGYTVIDWFYIMLHAKQNHHISTSTFFILQAIENKFGVTSEVFLYPRPNEDGLRGISKLNPTFKYTPMK